jgi:tRNA1Val (adenine37-N6)-methyltransferase
METVDDLGLKGFKIIQDDRFFKFGTDAVLLSDFAKIKKNKRVVDFGTGNGIIPLLLYGKYENISIKGLEILKDLYTLAKRNVELNDLNESITIINGDIRNAAVLLGRASADYVVTNPPYLEGDGLLGESEHKTVARHEIACKLKDLLSQAALVLNESGIIYMIHRTQRLTDVMHEMRTQKLEPKILRFISKDKDADPNLFLIKGIKNANPGIIIQKTLYIYDGSNKYSKEIDDIYGKG